MFFKDQQRGNGFAALKQHNPKLYRSWRGLIQHVIDRTDWGYLHANGRSKPRANKKENINQWVSWLRNNRPGPRPLVPRQLSLRRLQAHCDDQSCPPKNTIYYTSTPEGEWALLLLDIDDKDGTAKDAQEVFALLSALLPNIYGQTSTFGKGYHGYLLVKYGTLTVKRFRDFCKRLEKALVEIVQNHGFLSQIEVKGIPGLVTDGTYEICGQLAKFPICLGVPIRVGRL